MPTPRDTDAPEAEKPVPHQGLIGHDGTSLEDGQAGMLLRDWFAGHALAGLIPSDSRLTANSARLIALEAYWLADEMMVERARLRPNGEG